MEERTTTNQGGKSKSGSMIAIIGIIVIVAVVVIGYSFMKKPAAQTTTQSENTATQPSEAMAKKSSYKDGTYTVVGNYTSPGGPEELGVSLVLANGIVKDSTVTVKATRPNSVKFQTEFADNYKAEVVGKSIDELQLGKVSGSSLAPKGFNDAVDKIKAEAKS